MVSFELVWFAGINIADDGLAASLDIDFPNRNLIGATPARFRLDQFDNGLSALHCVAEIYVNGLWIAGFQSSTMALHHSVGHGDDEPVQN